MSKKYYVLCDSNCKYESMTKEQIFAAITEATGNTPTSIDEAFISKIKETHADKEINFWVGTEAEFLALGVSADNYILRMDSEGRIYVIPGDNGTAPHSFSHSTDGSDPITPEMIGAQEKLTFDTTPTSGSSSPVTSGGVYTALDGKAASVHKHNASDVNAGTLSADRLPTVPISKGGTGATTAAAALTNLGITATAAELNYVDGVTSNIQSQLNGKAASSHGNHVPATQTASNSTFLRNDNTWQVVTPANIGAAASYHTQGAGTITAGTLAGGVQANASAAATVTNAQVRNIYAGTSDMTPGSTALTSGVLYVVYE